MTLNRFLDRTVDRYAPLAPGGMDVIDFGAKVLKNYGTPDIMK